MDLGFIFFHFKMRTLDFIGAEAKFILFAVPST